MSAEVLRLMKLTPLWEPAIYLNKPIRTTLAQNITFRLE
jgi:hypothetical protein